MGMIFIYGMISVSPANSENLRSNCKAAEVIEKAQRSIASRGSLLNMFFRKSGCSFGLGCFQMFAL
jgi:hypothetical protein